MDEPRDTPDAVEDDAPEGGSAADALIASLREEGTEVSAGEFGLDREVAQRKLREYQLPDRRFYVLKIAQAAICQGASRVVFEVGRSHVNVEFDGRPFTERDFEGLYSELFTSTDNTERSGVRHLAIGLNAALALEPSHVMVVSGDGARGASLLSVPGAPDDIGPADEAPAGTTVAVQGLRRADPTGLGIDSEADTVGAHDRSEIEALLEKHCAYADVEILIKTKRLSGGLGVAGGVSMQEVSGPGVRGLAGFDPRLERRSEVRFVFDGIWIVTERLGGLPDGFVAVVEGTRLKMDISESGILKDEHHVAAHREVERARKASIRGLATLLEAEANPEGIDANWARAVVRQVLWPASDVRYYRGGMHDPLARGLASVPLWNALFQGKPNSTICSLREVLEAWEEPGRVAYMHVPTVRTSQVISITNPLEQGVCLVLEDSGDVRFLQRLVGDELEHLRDLEVTVAGAEERRLQREAEERGSGRIVLIGLLVLAAFVLLVILLALAS